MTAQHQKYMKLALEEAVKGWPEAAPNPMVGSVIVHNDKVVATGYHRQFGGPHAEVNAVNDLPSHIDPAECTIYVTLEPCSHHGKTPPCADLLIRSRFKEVVIAATDPNPLVAGKGICRLKAAGIKVVSGILSQEARALNKRFMLFHQQNRPYIILKWAISADGFISKDPVPSQRNENLITRGEAQRYVHRLRSETQAIMVGKNTALKDDPELSTRLAEGKNPVRVLIDRELQVPAHFRIYNTAARTIIFNGLKEGEEGMHIFKKLDFSADILPQIMKYHHEQNLQTLLVEGGAYLLNSLIRAGLWDEAYVFQNPDLRLGKGVKGPEFALKNSFELIGEDKLFHHLRNEALPADGPLSREIF